MRKIEIAQIPAQPIASYPKEFAPVISGREKQKIGDAVGLTQFGVNITRIKPGSASALRHWHEQEDEFIYLLEGEVVLQEDAGATVLKAGDAAGFRAGSGVAHFMGVLPDAFWPGSAFRICSAIAPCTLRFILKLARVPKARGCITPTSIS